MIIDTGAPDVSILTPNLYKPGPESVTLNKSHPHDAALNHTAGSGYGQYKKDGCGVLFSLYDGYEDTVRWNGLVAKGQRLAVADFINLNRTDLITQLPPRMSTLVDSR